jgi:hypothetical protein
VWYNKRHLCERFHRLYDIDIFEISTGNHGEIFIDAIQDKRVPPFPDIPRESSMDSSFLIRVAMVHQHGVEACIPMASKMTVKENPDFTSPRALNEHVVRVFVERATREHRERDQVVMEPTLIGRKAPTPCQPA